jgi:hypothetical protein
VEGVRECEYNAGKNTIIMLENCRSCHCIKFQSHCLLQEMPLTTNKILRYDSVRRSMWRGVDRPHASAPDQEAIVAISIIPATESKCEAVVSCGAPPEAPQQALTKWEEGGKDDDGSRDDRCHILPSLWSDTGY